MLEKLVLKDIKEKLRLLIEGNKQIYLNKMDEDDRENIEEIINKDVCSLEDINDLLINYFSFELDNEELYELVKSDCKKKILSKKDKVLLYVISNYLVNIKEYEEGIINIIGCININDIKEIDKYLIDKDYKDNDKILEIINKINIDNYSGKDIIKELKIVIVLFKNNLIDMRMVDLFFEGKIEWCDNYYLQYKNIYNVLMEKGSISNKNIVLFGLTFIRNIELFKDVKLNREDLICFIKKIEEMGFCLNDGQVNNLLDGFREKYYKDNDDSNDVVSLGNKVISEYSKYYSKYFYFRIEEFIEYYNELYDDDDFRVFCFDKHFRRLDKNIFDSIFYNGNVNESVIVLEKEVKDFNSFKIQVLDYKIKNLENEKVYYERYKFYLMYIDKVKEFSLYVGKIVIEYYILKNIPDNHRGEFYELFKCYYGDMYKKIARCGKAIGNSCELLKKEFIEELGSLGADKRYEVFNKYREYCLFLNCMGILNEKHLLDIMKEYEDGTLYTKIKKKKG